MFPYNLQNYQPKKDPEEPISDIVLIRAKAMGAMFISKDGKLAYKEQMRIIVFAYAPEFESWWYDPDIVMPTGVITI